MIAWLSDVEIDDLTAGVRTSAARARHLAGLGLVVNRKPNGRPLVMRAHAEAVLSGLAQIERDAGAPRSAAQPNRAALLELFGKPAARR